MQVEKKKNFIIKFLYFTIICIIIFLLSKYVIPILAPFIIGLIIAILVRYIVHWLLKKVKVNRTVLTLAVLVLIYALVIFLAVVLGARLAILVKDLLTGLPERYERDIQPAINTLGENITQRFPYLKDAIATSATNINDSVIKFIEKASTTFVNSLTNLAGTITSIMLKSIFAMISSAIFALDLPKIEGFIRNQMDDRTLHVYNNVIYNIGNTVVKFLRAYLIIITVTFFELAIGLTILGLKNSILLAMAIAVMDALPVIGTGTIMVPWILYCLITGNVRLAIGLGLVYAVIFFVRQVLEPNVVGESIGLHPIVMLICIFVGANLFGIVGLFLFPIAITILKKLNDDKVISIFN